LKPKKNNTILKGWDEGTTVQAFPFKRKTLFLIMWVITNVTTVPINRMMT
jgi:hypothetical protein